MITTEAKVREWRDRFRNAPLARSVVAGLQKPSADIWQRTFDLLQLESPEYRNSVDDDFTKESKSHCGELLSAIIAVAAGPAEKARADMFGFVRTHAEWRARHRMPLPRPPPPYRPGQ